MKEEKRRMRMGEAGVAKGREGKGREECRLGDGRRDRQADSADGG